MLKGERRFGRPGSAQRFYWGQAGGTYYLMDRDRGRIIALLYWESEVLGLVDGCEDEPCVCEPAWAWLAADNPDMHYELLAPVPTHDMSDEELAAAHDEALDEAQVQILEYLKGRRLL